MKKTTSINMGGIVLHIDEDAFEILNAYIKSLEKHFEKETGKQDILDDIELRIAELLSEELPDKNQAVKKEMVEKAIQIMGNPQQFDDDNPNTKEQAPKEEAKLNKQLFRNPEGKVLGGVCSGLGMYFNIDPSIIRVVFVLLTFFGAGFPIPLYIVMWIIIPEAQTLTQRMQMTGESINIDSIKRNAKSSVDDIKSSVRDFTSNKNTQHAFGQIGSFIGKVAPVIANVIFGLSIAAIVVAIIALIALEVNPNMICMGMPPTVDPEVIYFLTHVDVSLFGIGALLLGAAAVTSIFYILPNLIWGQQSNSRLSGQIVTAIITIGIVIMIIAITKSVVDYQALKEFIFLGVEK